MLDYLGETVSVFLSLVQAIYGLIYLGILLHLGSRSYYKAYWL